METEISIVLEKFSNSDGCGLYFFYSGKCFNFQKAICKLGKCFGFQEAICKLALATFCVLQQAWRDGMIHSQSLKHMGCDVWNMYTSF